MQLCLCTDAHGHFILVPSKVMEKFWNFVHEIVWEPSPDEECYDGTGEPGDKLEIISCIVGKCAALPSLMWPSQSRSLTINDFKRTQHLQHNPIFSTASFCSVGSVGQRDRLKKIINFRSQRLGPLQNCRTTKTAHIWVVDYVVSLYISFCQWLSSLNGMWLIVFATILIT